MRTRHRKADLEKVDEAVRYIGRRMSTASHISTRSDARRNREAILAAAREMFAESGDVAMYEVARRASVGQATLYRNFPDRDALVAALAIESIEELERLGAEHAGEPDAFFVMLRAMVDSAARFHGLAECAQQSPDVASKLEPLQQRLTCLIKRPLRDAKAAGLIRRDLSINDVMLLFAMVEGALSREPDAAGRAIAASRALALALNGLTAQT
jgi:AcrR family transcriptional regulator